MDSMEVIADVMRRLVGEGDNLAWWQGAVRAAIIFAGTWAMLRLAGRRAFAQKTSFDLCIVLLLGAVLSRAVVGATSFGVAFAAALALVLLHRAVGWLSSRYPAFDRATGGDALDLMREGELDRERVRRAMLTQDDLKANLRATLQTDSFFPGTRNAGARSRGRLGAGARLPLSRTGAARGRQAQPARMNCRSAKTARWPSRGPWGPIDVVLQRRPL